MFLKKFFGWIYKSELDDLRERTYRELSSYTLGFLSPKEVRGLLIASLSYVLKTYSIKNIGVDDVKRFFTIFRTSFIEAFDGWDGVSKRVLFDRLLESVRRRLYEFLYRRGV